MQYLAKGEASAAGDVTAPALDARLLIWLSPAFPVGAFAYSHGLEQAVERGLITSRDQLTAWLCDIVSHGSLRGDLILLAEAWRAATNGDRGRLAACNATALAVQPSAERHLETVTQGNAFMAAFRSSWLAGTLEAAVQPDSAGEVAYPVAVATAAAAHSIALDSTAYAYAIAFVSNLVSAAIRLSVIGQTDGQRVTAGLMPEMGAAARTAVASCLDDLGSATFGADLCSMAHETQYTRLFRS